MLSTSRLPEGPSRASSFAGGCEDEDEYGGGDGGGGGAGGGARDGDDYVKLTMMTVRTN